MQISGSKTGIQLLKDLESMGECELQLANDGLKKECYRKSSNQIHCDVAFQRIKILKAKKVTQLKVIVHQRSPGIDVNFC